MLMSNNDRDINVKYFVVSIRWYEVNRLPDRQLGHENSLKNFTTCLNSAGNPLMNQYNPFFSNYNLVIVSLLLNDNMFHYSAGYFIVNLEEHLNWCLFVSFYIVSQDHPVLVWFWLCYKGFYEAIKLYVVILFVRLSCFGLKVIMYILFVSVVLCI